MNGWWLRAAQQPAHDQVPVNPQPEAGYTRPLRAV
jgi:hypothetical protein